MRAANDITIRQNGINTPLSRSLNSPISQPFLSLDRYFGGFAFSIDADDHKMVEI
jgi:hypothetical protein